MAETRRPWTEEEIVKLKSMAGSLPLMEIAAKLRRSPGATAVAASKLKVSLRTRSYFGGPSRADDEASLER